MPVLTRRVGQSVRIGNDIQVVIVGARGEQVRIGILAPKTVPVKGQAPPKRGENQARPLSSPTSIRVQVTNAHEPKAR
jgi:carbon storage regulator